MDELITRHKAIMDQYDPDKRISLIVDEWGAWHQVEQGTNPGFLYQQNSVRDALVAGITLNIFHKHADRVRMANLAQMVNVLQSVVLTDKEKMLLTPTYHVLRMFQGHQGARSVAVDLEVEDLPESPGLPRFSASASQDDHGTLRLSLCHLDPDNEATLTVGLPSGTLANRAHGEVLTGASMDSHNTFAARDEVRPVAFSAFRMEGKVLSVTLPPRSVVVLTFEA